MDFIIINQPPLTYILDKKKRMLQIVIRLKRQISDIEEWKFPTIDGLIITFYEPYEHVLYLAPTPHRAYGSMPRPTLCDAMTRPCGWYISH